MKHIVNCETGEQTLVPLSDEDLAQQETDEANYLAAKAIADAEAEAKTAEKQALLDRLGISAEEAKLLLG